MNIIQNILSKPKTIILLATLSFIFILVGVIFIKTNKNKQHDGILIITYDLCKQQYMTTLAEQLNLDYRFVPDTNFEVPAFQVMADKKAFAKFDQLYDQRYLNDSTWIDESSADKTCHLHNVKYHVDNINEKLLPHIPNNADHVSYDPKGDNAVYCYYANTEKGGSQCYFISLHDDILQKDDISDMERANLVKASQLYNLRKGTNEFHFVRSWVIDWHREPKQIYGISLQTNYEGNRWGILEGY